METPGTHLARDTHGDEKTVGDKQIGGDSLQINDRGVGLLREYEEEKEGEGESGRHSQNWVTSGISRGVRFQFQMWMCSKADGAHVGVWSWLVRH